MVYRRFGARSSRRLLKSRPRALYSRKSRAKMVKGYTRATGYYGRFQSRKKVELKFWRCIVAPNIATLPSGAGVPTAAQGEITINTLVPAIVPTYRGFNSAGADVDIFYLAQVPQNATPSGRIGRKIFVRSLEGHMRIRVPPATTSSNQSIDIWVVQDTQTNGSLPAATDIWNGVPNLSLTCQSFYNLANEGRFKILSHKQFLLNCPASNTVASQYSGTIYDYNFACVPKCTVEFDQSTIEGTITSCRSNSFHMFACGTGTVGAVQTLTAVPFYLSGEIQIRYTDI